MWYRVRRIMQYAGFIVVLACLFNGITYNPLAAADDGEMNASIPSTHQSLSDAREPDTSIKAAIAENYGKLPLSFEANNGQVDGTVKFLSRGNGYTFYLTSNEAVLSLKRASKKKEDHRILKKTPQIDESEQIEREVVRLKNVGANPDPEITGLEELPGKSNYFIGNDPDKWQANVPNYAKVRVKSVYPGIDLVYYGNQRNWSMTGL